jgi:hypothetical protein
MKLSRSHEGGRTVLVFNRHSSSALDPPGLSRVEFDANPQQTTKSALDFNTRKTVSQTQLGLAFEQALGGGHKLELMGYGGQRQVVQFAGIVGDRQRIASLYPRLDLSALVLWATLERVLVGEMNFNPGEVVLVALELVPDATANVVLEVHRGGDVLTTVDQNLHNHVLM